MLLASFDGKIKSQFGHAKASPQNAQEGLDWEMTTAHLLQEYEDRNDRPYTSGRRNDRGIGQALVERYRNGGRRPQWNEKGLL